jgi:hypothetical protein
MMRTNRLHARSLSLVPHLPSTIPMTLIYIITDYWMGHPIYVLTCSHLPILPQSPHDLMARVPNTDGFIMPMSTTTLWSLNTGLLSSSSSSATSPNNGWQRCISWEGQRLYAQMCVSPNDGIVYVIGMFIHFCTFSTFVTHCSLLMTCMVITKGGLAEGSKELSSVLSIIPPFTSSSTLSSLSLTCGPTTDDIRRTRRPTKPTNYLMDDDNSAWSTKLLTRTMMHQSGLICHVRIDSMIQIINGTTTYSTGDHYWSTSDQWLDLDDLTPGWSPSSRTPIQWTPPFGIAMCHYKGFVYCFGSFISQMPHHFPLCEAKRAAHV